LSYGYYKQYAALDQRFAIQEKIDAWNEKFVQGKVNFDKWEKENEVGRKVLAALRTAWLVEERSLKKSLTKTSSSGRRTSRYRLIQVVYDAAFWSGRIFGSFWRTLLGRRRSSNGDGDDDNNSMSLSRQVREFMKGISMDISESRLNDIGARAGAVFAALIAVNITGALFAISPLLLACFAIVLGVAWPTWLAEFVQRMQEFLQETRARGRGDSSSYSVGSSSNKLLSPMNRGRQSRDPPPRRPLRTRYDRSRFHYYIQSDGQRRWYRTGQSWFGVKSSTDTKKKEDPSKKWPWQQSSSSSKQSSSWNFF
jgi:hypothetical protein